MTQIPKARPGPLSVFSANFMTRAYKNSSNFNVENNGNRCDAPKYIFNSVNYDVKFDFHII